MFELQAGHPLYQRSGLILLLAQFSLFIFGLPPFQVGVWCQGEPTLNAIFIFAVIDSLWILSGLARKYLAYTHPRPLVLCLLLWVGWQVVVTMFDSPSFWRSWFGPTETGEGAGRSVALLLLTMIACSLWQMESYRRIIIVCAAANIALQCLLHILNPLPPEGYSCGSWVPSAFGAYLAFMVGNLWIAAASCGAVKHKIHYALLILFTAVVLVISHNKSAMVLIPAAMLFSVAAMALSHHPFAARFFEVGKKWRALMVAACFLPMGWIAFSVAYGGSVGINNSGSFMDTVLHKEDGIGSRVALNQVAVSTMQHEPVRWLAGAGWGRFTDDIFKYALVDGVYVFKDGVRKPNWTALEGFAFHSHSQPLEVLLSLGLPGLLLWFAFPVIALLTLPRHLFWSCAPMLVGLVALYYFWFELPQCFAYDALLLAALSNTCHFTPRPARFMKPFCVAIAACSTAMLCSVWQQTEAIDYGEKLVSATKENKPFTDYTLDWLVSDLKRGGDRLQSASIGYAAQLGDKKSISGNERVWYGLLMEAAHIAAVSPKTGPRVASQELWMQYKLLIDFGGWRSFAELGHKAVLSMPDVALEMCRRVPLRDDFETMFLLNLPAITHDDKAQQEAILRKILAVAPAHRPAMWMLGQLLSAEQGHEAEGVTLMKEAVLHGVDTVYPVTNRKMEEVLQQH